jgi:hypothetical protein
MRSPKEAKPTLDPQRAIDLMRRQLAVDVGSLPYDDPDVEKWWNFTERVVAGAFGEGHPNMDQFMSWITFGGTPQQAQESHVDHVRTKKALLESFIEQLELFQPVGSSATLKIGHEGVFFAGQTFDALFRASQLFADAKASIVIIDGYLGDDVLNLLTKKATGVVVRILTKPLSPSLMTICKAFNQQYKGLSVRSSSAFHDRFVILDDREFYHFGASIKDAGKRAFMFSVIDEPDITNALRAKFEHEWNNAKVEI